MTDTERAALAEQLGFRTIGKELPDSVTLQDIIKSMPSEVFEFNMFKAWGAVFIAIASLSLSMYLISISPWYLLPFAWAFAGTAATGVSNFILQREKRKKENLLSVFSFFFHHIYIMNLIL